MIRFALLALVLVACGPGIPPVGARSQTPITVSVEDSCEDLAAHEFSIEGVEREGDFLLVQVSHAGGCGPHSYAACWSDEVLASDPPSFELLLFHNAEADMCEMLVTEVLRPPIRGDMQPSFLRETSVVLN